MDRTRRTGNQAGFTLIELLVVILIIGLLAAIALPVFLGQRAKAEDGSAKSNARNMVSAMESCYTEANQYDPCPDPDSGLAVGNGPGEVEVTAAGGTFTIVAHSQTGNTFTVEKAATLVVTRSCDGTANPRGGCAGGQW
jgi:type IV pilus assembly protein PilA